MGGQLALKGKYMLKKEDVNNTDDIIKKLIKSDRNIDIENEIERIMCVDLLVIDEISDDKCTIYQSEYQLPFFTTFLKKRLDKKAQET